MANRYARIFDAGSFFEYVYSNHTSFMFVYFYFKPCGIAPWDGRQAIWRQKLKSCKQGPLAKLYCHLTSCPHKQGKPILQPPKRPKP